jgi:hypothetical protein
MGRKKTSKFSTLRATGAGARTCPAHSLLAWHGGGSARADPPGDLDIVEYVRAARGGTGHSPTPDLDWTVESGFRLSSLCRVCGGGRPGACAASKILYG